MSIASSTASAQVATSSPQPTDLFVRHIHDGKDIDPAVLERCAKLFSENYGIWGKFPTGTKGPKPGTRVRMTSSRLREECVAAPDNTVLITCHRRDQEDPSQEELVGHAFAAVRDYAGGRVGWVTRLVVDSAFRKKHIATSLIRELKACPTFHGITAIGLAFSHPAAVNALVNYTEFRIESVDLNFCRQNAKSILEGSPVKYIRSMELHGSLFDDSCTAGAVSSLCTNFYVDHKEPLDVLAIYKARGTWRLGELVEGHEFLIILPI